MTTKPLPKYMAFSLLTGLLLAGAERTALADSYTNSLPLGLSLIVNQLDHGSNTANLIFPNPGGVHDTDALLLYNCTNQSFFSPIYFDSTSPSGFDDQSFNPLPAPPVLPPGAGFFYQNNNAAYSAVFTGTAHVPTLPPTNLFCGYGTLYVLGRQTNDIGNYTNITGLPPTTGAQVATWTGATFVTNLFTNGAWTGGEPSLAVGQAAKFFIPSPTIPVITAQPASLTVAPGQTAAFSVTAIGAPPLTYQWQILSGGVAVNLSDGPTGSGSIISGSATPNLTISGVTSSDAGLYQVVIANSYGPATSAAAMLAVASPSLVYQGLTNTGQHHATLAVSGNQLVVSNLTSGGQDGVSISLPGNLTGLDVNWQGFVYHGLTNSMNVQFTGGGTTGSPLGSLTLTQESTNDVVAAADFSAIGASTYTIQAFNAGVLVGQTTNQSGSAVASMDIPPDSVGFGPPPQDATKIITVGPFYFDWHSATSVILAGSTTGVTCDHLVVSPEQATNEPSPGAMEITASGISQFTIDSENASLVYQGLTNTSLGHASMAATGNELVVSNLTSGGQDGVSITLPASLSGLDIACQGPDADGSMPIGAYMQSAIVGTAGGVSNGVVARLRMTKAGPGDYPVTGDFSTLCGSNCQVLVQAYLDGILVGQGTVTNPVITDDIIVITQIDPDGTSWDTEFDDENCYKASTLDCVSDEAITLPGGASVLANKVYVIPQGIPLFKPTAFQFVAAGLQQFDITSENASLVYQGLTNSSLHHASVAASGSQLVVSNLTSGGQDGVSVLWPSNAVGLAFSCPPSTGSNPPPVGTFFQSQVVGSAGGITNGVVGTATVTYQGSNNYSLAADYSSIGAGTYTVQAYSHGVLVGQTTGSSGGAFGTGEDPPTTLDVKWIGNIPFISQSIHWSVSTTVTLNIGSAVTCDELLISPQNAVLSSPPSAFQLVAAGVLSFTLDSENASLVYQGLTNSSLHHASIAASGSQEVISNLTSGGQDGVTITLNPANNLGVSVLPWDPTNALPTGAYLQNQLIGTAGAITNGVLGTSTCTKEGSSNYVISVDYSPLGASSYMVQVYNGTTLVTTMPGQTSATVGTVKLPPGTCTINPFLNQEWPVPVSITLSSGPTVTGTEILMVPQGGSQIASVSADQIVGANIPSFTITSEAVSVNYDGLQVTAVGNTTLSLEGTELVATLANGCCISNLSSGGQDGLAFALPAGAIFDVGWTAFDPSNSLPEGAYLQEQIIGTAGGITNGPLGSVTMTKDCGVCPCPPGDPNCNSNYLISADFSQLGVSSFTVQAFLNGTLVAQAKNQPASAVAACGIWDDSGCIPQPPILGGGFDWTNDPAPFVTIGTTVVQCDHLYVIPNGVTGTPSAFQLTASQVPGLTVNGATVGQSLVYQGLTNSSLHHASMAASASQLVISNLTSGGQDGVSISLPSNLTGLEAVTEPFDPTNSLPVGAYVQEQAVGTGNGINGVVGTATVTKTGTGSYNISSDFSTVGATAYTVQAYYRGALVAQATDTNGANLAQASIMPINWDIEPVCCPWYWRFTHGWGDGGCLLSLGTGAAVPCDQLFITPQSATFDGPPAALNLTASQVPVITIDTENASLVYQGLTNTSLGHASMTIPKIPSNPNALVVSNLTSGGQDGVTVTWPSNAVGLAFSCPPAGGSNPPPVGTFFQGQIVGSSAGITNGVLGAARVTYVGQGTYSLAADYSPIGAGTYTVQALSQGVLVAQTTGGSGKGFATGEDPPTTLDVKLIGSIPIISQSIHWSLSTKVSFNNGPAVTCDELLISPQNTVLSSPPSAFQLVAAGVSSFTLDGENASFVYQGLTNTSLGHASIALSGSQEVISNLTSGGQDGVTIALNPGNNSAVSLLPWDPTNALPTGAYLQSQLIGNASGITNGVLGSITCRKQGGDNYSISVDYSPLGASSYTIEVFNGATLVTILPGQTSATVGTVKLPPGTCTINPELNQEWPVPTSIALSGGLTVTGTEILVVPQGGAAISSVSADQIVASDIPSFTITSEAVSVNYNGLQVSAMGNATLAVEGSSMVATFANGCCISNLSSGGQDGLAFALPAGSVFDAQWSAFDPSNSLPEGAFLQEQIIGSAGNVTNGPLGSVTMTKDCGVCPCPPGDPNCNSNYLISADFSALGVSSFTVQAFLNGTLVAQATNQPASAVASCGVWGDSGCIPRPPILGGGWDWTNNPAPFVTIAGTIVQCDHLYVIPNGVTGTPSAFELTASQVPGLTVNGTSVGQSFVYQGTTNTSLGQAAPNVKSGVEVITNLTSSGQDGVDFALANNLTSFNTQWLPLDVSNTLPVGAYVQARIISAGDGVSDVLLGTVTVTKAGPTNYQVAADFSAAGASNYTAEAFLSGTSEAEATGLNGASLAEISEMPNSFDLLWVTTPFGYIVIPVLDWHIPFPYVAFGGTQVTADHLQITPQNLAFVGTPTDLQIVASQVPSLTLTGTSVSPLLMATTVSGQNLTLQWMGAAMLQQSSDLANWSAVTGATSPYTVQTTGPVKFYRLIQPPIR